MFTRADVRWLSDTVAAVYAAQTTAELAAVVLALAQRHFRSAACVCDEIALDFSYYVPHAAHFETRMPDDWMLCIHDHPAWEGLRNGGIEQQFQVAESFSRRLVEKTDFYNGIFRPTGVRDELAMIAKTETDLFSIALCRDGLFTAVERDLAMLAQPHWLAAWHRVRRLRDSRGPLRLELAPDLRPIHPSADMRRILQAYFPGWRASEASLPARLADWVRASFAAVRNPSPHRLLRALIVDAARGRLLARCFPCADGVGCRLVFVETPADPNYLDLNTRGLTSRECEVVHWLSAGKRDAEIAAILGVAPKTVGKHVENVLRKFGAETRGGAVCTAREWLHHRC